MLYSLLNLSRRRNPKTENETVYYNVDYIHTAIYENKQIKFHYGEWTVKKKLKLKKDGAFYVVSPWALTWDNENYYLVAYDTVVGIIKHYRVDKMQNTVYVGLVNYCCIYQSFCCIRKILFRYKSQFLSLR